PAEAGTRERAPRRGCRRRRRGRAGSWIEAVADAPDRVQVERPARIGFDLLAQPPHVDGHRARVDCPLVAPDAGHQLVPGEDVAGMRGEEPEQLELLRGELKGGPGTAGLAAGAVELDLAEGDRLAGRRDAVAAAEHRAHARGKLPRRERL